MSNTDRRALATAEIGEDGNITYTVKDMIGNVHGMTVHPEVAAELYGALGVVFGVTD